MGPLIPGGARAKAEVGGARHASGDRRTLMERQPTNRGLYLHPITSESSPLLFRRREDHSSGTSLAKQPTIQEGRQGAQLSLELLIPA